MMMVAKANQWLAQRPKASRPCTRRDHRALKQKKKQKKQKQTQKQLVKMSAR
jgi:hypothetical protein